MYPFELDRPVTIDAALALLQDEEAMPLAGGQTLIPTMKQRLAAPERLVSLMHIPELRGICRDDDGRLCIGAATTHAEVAAGATEIAGLASLAGRIGDPAVRNRGTIGGSLANNDPSACYSAALLALGGTVMTQARQIPADDFFQGMFTTALEPGELIVELRFSVPLASAYAKFAQPASRFALVGVFVARFADGVRVAVTGASEEGVFRWAEAEAALTADFGPAAVQDLAPPPEEGMIGDIHASPAYRAHLVRVMTARAVQAALGG